LRPAAYFILLTFIFPQSIIVELSFLSVYLILSESIPNFFSHEDDFDELVFAVYSFDDLHKTMFLIRSLISLMNCLKLSLLLNGFSKY
jgi:hypothetical protein